MILLTSEQTATLKSWFLPESPGPVIGSHVLQTGHGVCFANRWPFPQMILVKTAGNFTLLGDTSVFVPADMQPLIKGFVVASKLFLPSLKAAFPELKTWPRIIFTQQEAPGSPVGSPYLIRRLNPSDAHHLLGIGSESDWISKTWGGPAELAASGFAWGAFIANQLASVACTFFLGMTYEDIGVVTKPEFQGNGLGTACVRALCQDIWNRGHQPSWTTSPDNLASRRVAEKLRFSFQRYDVLYVVNIPIPKPAE